MPRHALDPDEPRAPRQRPPRIGTIVGPFLAVGWLWLARTLLGALAVAIVLCRLTGASFDDLPQGDSPGPLLPQLTMALCLAAGILSVYIFLPHSFAGLTRRSGDLLVGRTVLGRRSIDLRRARAFLWSIPTNTGTVEMVALVGRPSGLLIVGSTGTITSALDLEHLLSKSIKPRPNRFVSRIKRVVVSTILPLILITILALGVVVVLAAAAPGG